MLRTIRFLLAVMLSNAVAALPAAAQVTVTVPADSVTQTGATVVLSGHGDWWHYKRMSPTVGTCTAVTNGQSASLSDLGSDVAYTYHVFNGWSCATENKIGEASFTTLGFKETARTRTTATLTLKNYPSGQEWWYQEWYPSAGSCTSAGTGTSVSLTGLTKNQSYSYQAYRASGCSSGDWIGSAHFKTLPAHVLKEDKLTQTTVELELVNVNVPWQLKKTKGPGASTCTKVPLGTSKVDITGLTANTDYTYTAYRNQDNTECAEQEKIDWIDFTTLPDPPNKPTPFSATALIEGATLSWTSGGDNGGAITKWEYQQKTGNTWGTWTTASTDASTTSHTVTGLTGGTDYAFKVRATNAGGAGTASDEVSVTALVEPEVNLSLNPTSVAEDASATSVTVTAALSNSNTFTTDKTVTVTVGGSGTATSGTDYAAVSNFDITITKGTGSGTGTFTLTPTDDTSNEGDETIGIAGSATGLTVNSVNLTLTDDDEATVTIDDASASEGDAITFTVTLDEAVPGGLTVTPSYANGTAADGDYTANTTGLSFTGTANETKTFTVSTTEDAVFEADETFTVALAVSNTTLNVTASDTGTGTINNDDSAAATVNDADADEGDSMTFTVTLSEAVQGGLTVTPGYTNGTAASADYTTNTTGLTFTGTKGETKTFTVSTTEDAVLEADETFTVGLTVTNAPSGVTSTDTGAGTINNDDSAAVTVNDADADEGDAMTFTVTLSEAVQGGLTVTPGYTNGTAASADYTTNTTGLTFTGTKGETKTFTVSTTEDAVLEADETFTVGLTVTNAPSGVTSTDTGAGTINNDDSAAVTVNDADADEGDAMTFTVTLSAAVQGGLKVTPGYTNGTAASTDYTANTTALTFTGTANETKTFTVSTTEDQAAESDETFTVGLSVSDAPSGVTSTDTGAGTINDDDGSGINVTVNNASASEGDAMTFTVTLSAAVQGGLTVTPGYTNGTAANTDYTANTTALTFTGTANETKTFTVSTAEDAVLEADETFTVGLTVSGTSVNVDASDTGTGTINNDDSAAVTVNDADADEGDAMTFTVTLSAAVQGGLTVTPGYTNVTAASSDYTAKTTGLTFTGTKNETQTFTVSTVNDAVVEGDETFTVRLAVSGTSLSVDASDTGRGTVNDDDAAPSVDLSVNPASVAEGATTTVTVSAAFSSSVTFPSDKTVTVSVGGTGTATPGVDFTNVADFAITIRSGQTSGTGTFVLAPTADGATEGTETIGISGTSSGLAVGATSISLTDNTSVGQLVLAVDPAQTSVDEGAGEIIVSVAARVPAGQVFSTARTVAVSVGGGTATSGADYEAVPGFDLTIPAGQAESSATFRLVPIQDELVEGDETIHVTGVAEGLNVTLATITLVDDDEPPPAAPPEVDLSVTPTRVTEGSDAVVTVTAELTPAISFPVDTVVTVSVGGGTATPGADYAAVPDFDITIPAGRTSAAATFTLSPVDDDVVEGDETIEIAGSAADLTVNGDLITVMDIAEKHMYLDVDPDIVSEGASATTVTVTASLTGGRVTSANQRVTVAVVGGSATAGEDFTAVPDFDVTIPAGKGSGTGTFTLSPISDAWIEEEETISLTGTAAGWEVVAATLALRDDDEVPAVELSVDPATVDEGASATPVTVTATFTNASRFAGDRTVTVSVNGGTATPGTDFADVADIVVTIPAGAGSGSAMFTLTLVSDALVEGDEMIELSGAAEGLAVTGTALTVADDDELPAVELSVDPATVEEGAPETPVTVTAAFTSASVFSEDRVVTVSVNGGAAMPGEDYAAVSDFDITIAAGETSGTGTFTLTPMDDAVVEADETIELSGAAEGLAVTGTALTVADDDERPAVELSVDPATVEEGASATPVTVTAAFTNASVFSEDRSVTVTVGGGAATPGQDYAVVPAFEITIPAGSGSGSAAFTLTPMDDDVVEEDETIELAGAADGLAVTGTTVTVADDDEGRERARALGTGLATFGRTIATQAVDVIGARFDAASRHVRAAELASLFGPDPAAAARMLATGHGGAGYGGTGYGSVGYGAPGLDGVGARPDARLGGFGLGGSHGLASGRPLALSLAGGNGDARGWSLWASGARTDFAGRPGGFSVDGTMSAAFVGVDHTLGGGGLFGVAVSRSQGDAGLESASNWTGDVGTRMTTVYPYLRLAPGRGFDLWGMVGVGRGDVDIADGAGAFEADGSLEMAAAGLRGRLARLGGFDLAVRADAFTVGMMTDEVSGGPDAAEGRAQRLRLLLDGSAHLRLSSSSRLTPSFEVGARADDGDAETGLGMEVGGGLAYANTRLGLDIAARGRWLARHENEDFEEWGGNVSIRRVPSNPNRGLSLLVEPAWGEDASGVAALWEGRGLRRGDFGFGLGPERAAEAWRPDRLDMEMAYGTGLLGRDHSLKPFGRLRLMGGGSRHMRVGTRLEFANAADAGLRLELLGEQRARAGAASNYGAGLNVGMNGLRTAAGLLAPFGEVVLDGRSGRRVAFGTRWRVDGAELGGAVPGGLRLELAGEAYREANEPVEFGLVLRGGVGLGMW